MHPQNKFTDSWNSPRSEENFSNAPTESHSIVFRLSSLGANVAIPTISLNWYL